MYSSRATITCEEIISRHFLCSIFRSNTKEDNNTLETLLYHNWTSNVKRKKNWLPLLFQADVIFVKGNFVTISQNWWKLQPSKIMPCMVLCTCTCVHTCSHACILYIHLIFSTLQSLIWHNYHYSIASIMYIHVYIHVVYSICFKAVMW